MRSWQNYMSRWSMIVWVILVLNFQSQSELYFLFVCKVVVVRSWYTCNRFLKQSSNNLTSHKATTTQTDYLNNIFIKSKYNVDYVKRNTLGDANSNTGSNVDSCPFTTATCSTSEAHLNLSHLTTYALHTNQ